MSVICLLNQKGGVGKTSTCFHLSGTLAHLGRRVLLVDNDPQASLTQGFLGPDVMRDLRARETVASLYAGEDPFPEQVIRPVMARVDLLLGSPHATDFNVPRPQDVDPAIQCCLRRFLGDIRGQYDTVLIDCPPNRHLCSWAALVASDRLIIPLNPEDYGAQGIVEVLDLVDRVVAGPNPSLYLAEYLLTRVFPRLAVHKLYIARLRDMYPGQVFETMIPHSADYLESILCAKPAAAYKPKGTTARAMKALVEEMDTRAAAKRVA